MRACLVAAAAAAAAAACCSAETDPKPLKICQPVPPIDPDTLPLPQEADYIRQEARQQFRAAQAARYSEEQAAAAVRAVRCARPLSLLLCSSAHS